MNKYKYIFLLIAVLTSISAWGQVDRKEVRHGNRKFKKENYEAAFQDYLRAVEKDTSSIAANYNMASALYRMEQYDQAQQALDRVKDVAPASASAADYLYNKGNVALQKKDYQAAVEAFGQSLVLRPDDLAAKENYIYARMMLQNQQNQQQNDQNQDNNDQNQDQNQNDQNQNDQNQNDQNQDNQDQNNKDDDQNDQKQDDRQDNNDQNQDQQQNDKPQNQEGQPQQQEAQITPQAAQQMLQAIQAKEKETQDKVNKKKAMALKSRQKDKNW